MKINFICLFIVSVVSLAAQEASATAMACASVFTPPKVTQAFSMLQDPAGRGLIQQDEFNCLIRPGGGGACATVSAVHLIQGLRIMTGETEVLDARRIVHEAYRALPVLRDGRVTNEQIVDLLTYLKKYSTGFDFEFSVDTDAPNFTSESLAIRDGELKLVIYRVYRSDGNLLGRHFVVLKERPKLNVVTFVDPNRPLKSFEFCLLQSAYAREKGGALELSSLRPGAQPANVVDTVLTVTLRKATQK